MLPFLFAPAAVARGAKRKKLGKRKERKKYQSAIGAHGGNSSLQKNKSFVVRSLPGAVKIFLCLEKRGFWREEKNEIEI